ncbi:MAG: hypothetical protein MUF66_10030 [Gammaproteobacteria bacterium]|jgi:hypothetical protein|nr:hypothetical protein [Gammaproteobacteria bacterium]
MERQGTDAKRVLLQVLVLIGVAALTRLVPHPPNLVPMGAIALVSGALLGHRALAYVVPLAGMLLADLVLGLHAQIPAVYASMAAVVWLGSRLGARRGLVLVTVASVAGSTLFFLVTNLSVWAFDGLYPPTLDGLIACYVAALPFFGNSLAADLLFTGVLLVALSERAHRCGAGRGPVRLGDHASSR